MLTTIAYAIFYKGDISMEITTNQEEMIAKVYAQVMKNLETQLVEKELTEEEVQANLVLSRKAAMNDSTAIANLVFSAFAE